MHQSVAVVYGNFESIRKLDDDSFWSFRTLHGFLYSMAIFYLSMQYGYAIISTYYSRSSIFLIIPCVLYCILPIQWGLVDISSSTLLLSFNIGYFGTFRHFRVCSSTLLLHFVIRSYWKPIASNEVFRDVLPWLDRIFRWCVAVLPHDVPNVIAFATWYEMGSTA